VRSGLLGAPFGDASHPSQATGRKRQVGKPAPRARRILSNRHNWIDSSNRSNRYNPTSVYSHALILRSCCVHAISGGFVRLEERQKCPFCRARLVAASVLLLAAISRCALGQAIDGDMPRLLMPWQIADARMLDVGPDDDVVFDSMVMRAAMFEPADGTRSVPATRGGPDAAGMTDEDYLRAVRPDLVKPDRVRPNVLRSPTESAPALKLPLEEPLEPSELLTLPMDAPVGFTGPSSVFPREGQTSSHFVPIEDRWRIGLPQWDRYGLNHPPLDDYPYTLGRELDPYHQNVLKGDYPIIGQHTFLNFTGEIIADFEGRQVPTPTTPFESTGHPGEFDFFGNPNQFFTTDFFVASFDLFHGDAAFKPVDWRIKLTPIFDMN